MKEYTLYKDCDIPWLSSLPTHWVTKRAKYLFSLLDRPVEPHYEVITCFRDGVVTLRKNRRQTGFTESLTETGYQGIKAGDLVIHQMDAFAGSVGVSDSDGKSTPVYSVCSPKEELSPYYYAYIIREMARTNYILSLAKGIRQRSTDFRFPTFARCLLPVPPVEEQNAIVSYLDKKCAEIDELVTRRQAIIERLKELKQSIIAEVVTKGLNPDAPMKDSGIDWLGEVPQHWVKYRTPSILKVTSKAGTDSDELLSVYLDRGVIKHSESDGMQVHKPSKDMSAYQKVLPGNFVCNNQQAWRGSVGVSEHEGRISPAYIIFNLSSKLEPKFANYFFRSQAWNPSFVYSSKGVGSIQRNLYLPWLRQHYCYLPSTEEQQAIVTYLDKKCAEIDELVARQEQIIEKLKELKTSTIAHVVTGKVDVRDAI